MKTGAAAVSSKTQVQIVRARLGGVHLDEFALSIRPLRRGLAVDVDEPTAFAAHVRANGEPLRQSATRWRERLRVFRRLLRARVVVRTSGRVDRLVIEASPKLVEAMTRKEWDRVIREATNSRNWCTACHAGNECVEHPF
jgi:hypothetical protein